MTLRKNIAGLKFGRLTVIRVARRFKFDNTHYRTFWLCECECGKEKEVVQDALCAKKRGTKSCGCLHKDGNIGTHRKSGTPTYKIWTGIKKRCYQVNSQVYYKYGGRGIQMCERWKNSFEAFLEDMGERPEGLTIERENVNGHYEKANCRWATPLEQASNKRNTVSVVKGESLKRTAAREGVSYKYLHKLFRAKGFSFEEALAKAKSAHLP